MPPTSYQEPATGSKAAKFIQANPLDPMIRPFENGVNDEQKDMQQMISENVHQRLEKAVTELQLKHQNGTNEMDAPEFAPTGSAYQMIYQQQRQQKLAEQAYQQQQQTTTSTTKNTDENYNNIKDNDSDSDDDSYLDDDNDDDPILEAIRQKRLQELRQQQIKYATNKSLGHGQYRTITQDEFLPECTGSSTWVVVHFFHNDYQRCTIMDHHLHIIATKYMECKFLRLNAEKTPFFVSKLNIITLPTVLVFCNGKVVDRLIGFDQLLELASSTTKNNNYNNTKQSSNPDEWETYQLEKWLELTSAITILRSSVNDNDASNNDQEYESDTDIYKKKRTHSSKFSLYRGGKQMNDGEDDD